MIKKFIKIIKLFTTTGAGLCLILSLLSLPCCVFSEELLVVGDIAQNIQSSYEKTKDLKADFIQEATIKSIKKTEREEHALGIHKTTGQKTGDQQSKSVALPF
jgi:outer membrane lipoprotein-sorting protein